MLALAHRVNSVNLVPTLHLCWHIGNLKSAMRECSHLRKGQCHKPGFSFFKDKKIIRAVKNYQYSASFKEGEWEQSLGCQFLKQKKGSMVLEMGR